MPFDFWIGQTAVHGGELACKLSPAASVPGAEMASWWASSQEATVVSSPDDC
jgi:hypothetical protein